MQDKSLELLRNEEYLTYARVDLSVIEFDELTRYVIGGGHPLAPETSAKFFELYLSGSDAREIHRLNKAFPIGAILDSQVRYRWSEQKDKYAAELQNKIRDRVISTQLETTGLMADLLLVAKKRYGDKLKKYIQTGDEAHLDKELFNIRSLADMLKIMDGLLKVTGQDKISKVKTESVQTLNVNVNKGANLTPEEAAEILRIVSESKNRGSNESA